MALLPILEFPDPRLRTKAQPVAVVDQAVRRLVDDLLDTMYAAPGIGLAATAGQCPQARPGHRRERQPEGAARVHQPGVGRTGRGRRDGGGLSLGTGCLRQGHPCPEHIACGRSIVTVNPSNSWLTGCLLSASSTRWIISRASCFVDYLSELKRTRIRKKLDKERKEHAASGTVRARPKVPVI